jgi:hypothetical protein
VKLVNGDDWCDRHSTHKAREISSGPMLQWLDGHGERGYPPGQ